MAIDVTFPPEIDAVRTRVQSFLDDHVRPLEARLEANGWDRGDLVRGIVELRALAREQGLWLPHMPPEWGGMGLTHVQMAAVSAEAGKTRLGSFILNAQAPDEGNMHTLLHWATDAQKEEYLRPLCEGTKRSCFASSTRTRTSRSFRKSASAASSGISAVEVHSASRDSAGPASSPRACAACSSASASSPRAARAMWRSRSFVGWVPPTDAIASSIATDGAVIDSGTACACSSEPFGSTSSVIGSAPTQNERYSVIPDFART
jgi:hypothetical protein